MKNGHPIYKPKSDIFGSPEELYFDKASYYKCKPKINYYGIDDD